MKKKHLLSIILVLFSVGYGYSQNANYIPKFTNTSGSVNNSIIFQSPGNNVGIGTTSPITKLDVSGSIFMPFGNSLYIGSTSTTGERLRVYHDGGWGKIEFGKVLHIKGNETLLGGENTSGAKLTIHHALGSANEVSGHVHPLVIWSGWNSGEQKLSIGVDRSAKCAYIQSTEKDVRHSTLSLNALGGSVAIGTTDAKGYKLAVAGKMIAEEIVCKPKANWPDYVFEDNYQLRTLEEVESFIKLNKHLPDVPSANEILESGLNIGDINSVLLQKIEELTIYTIEQQKIINELVKEIKEIKEKN